MNILVTGGRGQLGCSLEKASRQYPGINLYFTDMPEGDITDHSCIRSLIEKYSADGIINCAAYTAVDKAETDQELAHWINALGPQILGELCAEYDIPLIQVSTDYVFDGNGNRPLSEAEPADAPLGVYGKTKREGEIAVEQSGCKAAVVRTAWLYSEFGNNFVKTMIRLGETKPELGVIYDQIGTPTYAPDLADALLQLLTQGVEGYEIYHYTNEGVCSWYDFAHEIFDLRNMNVRLNAIETWQYPTPAARPHYSLLNKSKIKNKGIQIPHWRDSLKECLKAL